jgi:predicted nucleotide-binding protein
MGVKLRAENSQMIQHPYLKNFQWQVGPHLSKNYIIHGEEAVAKLVANSIHRTWYVDTLIFLTPYNFLSWREE